MALTSGDIRRRRCGVTALDSAQRKSAGTIYRAMWSGTECHSSAYSLPVPYVYRTARNLDDRFTWNRGSCWVASGGQPQRAGAQVGVRQADRKRSPLRSSASGTQS